MDVREKSSTAQTAAAFSAESIATCYVQSEQTTVIVNISLPATRCLETGFTEGASPGNILLQLPDRTGGRCGEYILFVCDQRSKTHCERDTYGGIR